MAAVIGARCFASCARKSRRRASSTHEPCLGRVMLLQLPGTARNFFVRLHALMTGRFTITAISDSRWIIPGRRTRGGCVVRSSTVDSMPTWDWPPSTMSGMRPSKLRADVAGVVGETRLERLALGAASGKPHSRIDRLDERMARPTHADRRAAGRHNCRGCPLPGQHERERPGQNAAASLSAVLGQLATQRCDMAVSATWTMMDYGPVGP